MKNFRKVLALVLVVATLFSFASMAGAKTLADYKDADTVTYEQAVDVLTAIEILNGYTDGNIKPTGYLTRGEMAKMVATMANAGDNVSDLYASACTFADSKNHWAASYIAYCAQTDIVNGYTATTFGPDDNVTGIQTAKMLLCMLGLNPEAQGYVGSNWTINVLRDAKNLGLLDGLASDWDPSNKITREEAAQLFLNALNTPVVVGVISDNIVTITNAVFNGYKVTTLIDAEKYGWVNLYGNVIIANNKLGEVLYGNRLTLGDGNDCFGRPGTTWKFIDKRGNTVLDGFYVDTDADVYTTEVDATTAYKSLATVGYTAELYVDGTKTTPTVLDALAYATAHSHNGVRTEVYVDEAARDLTVVVINPYWGTITDVTDYTSTATYTLDNKATYKQVIEGAVKGDIVLAHICNKDCGTKTVHDVTIIEPTIAKVEYVNDPAAGDICDEYFIAGEKYFYNVKAQKATSEDATSNNEVAIYQDEYDYVIAVADVPAAAAPQYAAYVVEGTIKEGETTRVLGADGNWTSDTVYTGTIAPYGTAGAVTLVEAKGMDEKATAKLANGGTESIVTWMARTGKYWSKAGALVVYTENAAGELQLVQDAVLAPAGTTISSSNVISAAGNLYANNESQFMIRTGDSYEIVIGYKNLTETYVAKDINGIYSSIQYIANANGMLKYVFIDADWSRVDCNFMILGDKYQASSMTLPGYPNYKAYRALVDGVDSFVLIADGVAVKKEVLYVGADLVRAADTKYDDNKPLYVLVEASTNTLEDNVATWFNKVEVDSTGEVQVWIGNTYKVCAEDFTVYYIGVGDNGYTAVSGTVFSELLKDAANGNYFGGYYTTSDGLVDALYICDTLVTAE